MARAYIGLGSNLGDREGCLRAALQALRDAGVAVLRSSRFIATLPVGKTDQPDFLNAAAALGTGPVREELLGLLLRIESSLGRVRAERWGPRTLDLDLLLYDDEIIREPGLEVPHPRRPVAFFGTSIHDQCSRCHDYDNDRFALKFGQVGCLYKLGCAASRPTPTARSANGTPAPASACAPAPVHQLHRREFRQPAGYALFQDNLRPEPSPRTPG